VKDVKYLLIGGGLAGFHAAKQIRRADAEGPVLIVSEESLPPYDRPPLSKEYLRGEKSADEIVFEPVEKFTEQQIEIALGVRAESLDVASKMVALSDGETVRFEKALLATGGRPVMLSQLPGITLPGVHYLRTAADVDAIARDAVAGRKALIIGGGFIGVEVAASLTQRGVEATVIEAQPRIWSRFADESLAGYIEEYCGKRGVAFLTNDLVTELRGDDRVRSAVTRSGRTLDCDLVVIGVGIVPNIELAQAAGLAVENGIVVDEQLRTSAPDVYAAGDVINYPDAAFGKRRRVEHWGHAEYSGQIAGRNMAGNSDSYDFISYVWSDIFDLHLEFAGDESEHDRTLLRGSFANDSFIVIYLKAGLVTAYFAVNTDVREYSTVRRLIRAKKDVSGHESEIENPSFNLRGLL
jgi:NADPH-dependent 2,4-dienoyl-CoA reductase/sulfur reductase-like enzyme